MNEREAIDRARSLWGANVYIRRTVYAKSNDAFHEVGKELDRGEDQPLGVGSSWEAAFQDAAELERYDRGRRNR